MLFITFFLLLLYIICKIDCLDEYSYSLQRESLRQFDISSQNKPELNEKEKIVDNYLKFLKSYEFKREGRTNFYASRPLELFYASIINSTLYKHLKQLPKGGNLHLHEDQALDRRLFLQKIKERTPQLYDILYICINKDFCQTQYYFLDYFMKDVPNGWIKVKESNLSVDDILSKTTLFGLLEHSSLYATDTSSRWNLCESNGLFGTYLSLYNHNLTRLMYLETYLDEALGEGVQLIEFRRSSFGTMWYFNENGDKKFYTPLEEAQILFNFKENYLKRNQKLIDFNYIVFAVRRQSIKEIQDEIDALFEVQFKYPSLVRGFDMVGEEDAGHTLLFHIDTLISHRSVTNYFFHNAETNFPEDYLTSNQEDMVSTTENIYDALALNTHRIGHGLGFFKHPSLYPLLRDSNIAIEICPASNQLLGYTPDLRMHPGLNYYRSQVPIVIGGDDPGAFGYNELTIDYFLIYLAWGLDLADLKRISFNSIKYSSLSLDAQSLGALKWAIEWSLFIDKMSIIACSGEISENNFSITRVFPSYGPNSIHTSVTLFGSGLESLLCKSIICKFGEYLTRGELVSFNQVKCKTPIVQRDSNLSVLIELIANEREFDTKMNYTFIKIQQEL